MCFSAVQSALSDIQSNADNELQLPTSEKGKSEPPTESDYVRYFFYMKTKMKYKPSSLWSYFGRLNNCHKRRYGTSLQQWPRLSMLLKSYDVGHVKKKASVFHLHEIEQALQLSYDCPYWVLRKAAVAVAYCGALRGCELRSLTLGNVRIDDEAIWVDFYQGKQRGEEKINGFAIPFNRTEPQICMATRVVDYRMKLLASVPDLKPEDAFWRRTLKYGYSEKEVMGKWTLAKIGKEVAAELNLSKPNTYTGHCFRRSTSTNAAERGATGMDLQLMAGWKNPKTALEYIDGTKERKRRMARFVTGVKSSSDSQQAKEGNPAPSKTSVSQQAKEDSPAGAEELTIESRNQKVYKLDLRGAQSITFNMS